MRAVESARRIVDDLPVAEQVERAGAGQVRRQIGRDLHPGLPEARGDFRHAAIEARQRTAREIADLRLSGFRRCQGGFRFFEEQPIVVDQRFEFTDIGHRPTLDCHSRHIFSAAGRTRQRGCALRTVAAAANGSLGRGAVSTFRRSRKSVAELGVSTHLYSTNRSGRGKSRGSMPFAAVRTIAAAIVEAAYLRWKFVAGPRSRQQCRPSAARAEEEDAARRRVPGNEAAEGLRGSRPRKRPGRRRRRSAAPARPPASRPSAKASCRPRNAASQLVRAWRARAPDPNRKSPRNGAARLSSRPPARSHRGRSAAPFRRVRPRGPASGHLSAVLLSGEAVPALAGPGAHRSGRPPGCRPPFAAAGSSRVSSRSSGLGRRRASARRRFSSGGMSFRAPMGRRALGVAPTS